MKNRRFVKSDTARIILVLASVMALTGCHGGKYERIELAGPVQNGSTGGTGGTGIVNEMDPGEGRGGTEGGIVLEGSGGSAMESTGIVIEPETAAPDMAGLEAGQGALQGAAQNPLQEADQNTLAGAEDTMLFGGDVLLSSHVLNAYQKAGGIHGVLDEGYRDVIRNADFFMVNEEFPFSSRGVQAEDKEYTFRLEPERVSMFQEMGIDGVTLANNHALDFGQDALLDSIATLDSAGILHTGAGADLAEAGRPVETELGGRQIAVIGATRVIPVSSWAAGKDHPGMLASYDPTALLKVIRTQKEAGKLVIVYVHWGGEKDEKPQEYQRTLGQQYIDAGADLVIGAHPHVLQGIEYYKGRPIVYSLGNFVFGSSIPKTMLLEVRLPSDGVVSGGALENESPGAGASTGGTSDGGTSEDGADRGLRLRLIPGTSGAGYTRLLTDAQKVQEFYQYMESISFGVKISEDGIVNPGS